MVARFTVAKREANYSERGKRVTTYRAGYNRESSSFADYGTRGAQLPRVLDDPKVDVAIISTTYIQQTGLSPVHDSVFIEDKNSPYVNILVAREDNKNAENVKEFLQSYQSPEVAKAAETIFNGGAVPGW